MKTFGSLAKALDKETTDGVDVYHPKVGYCLMADGHKRINMMEQNDDGNFYLSIDDGNDLIVSLAQLSKIDVYKHIEW